MYKAKVVKVNDVTLNIKPLLFCNGEQVDVVKEVPIAQLSTGEVTIESSYAVDDIVLVAKTYTDVRKDANDDLEFMSLENNLSNSVVVSKIQQKEYTDSGVKVSHGENKHIKINDDGIIFTNDTGSIEFGKDGDFTYSSGNCTIESDGQDKITLSNSTSDVELDTGKAIKLTANGVDLVDLVKQLADAYSNLTVAGQATFPFPPATLLLTDFTPNYILFKGTG